MRKVPSKGRQSGNIFFMLFGAVGLVGVVGAATTTIMKGPVRSMSEVTKNTVAENAMVAAGRLALVSAATQAQHGDCDNDQYIEPLPFSDTGTGPRPAGGGYLPPSIGAAQKDPWGSTYGYCSWDHGTRINDAGCGGAAQKRLRGSATEEKIALAVISAGPNRVFETSCGHDPAYLVRVPGSDDVILEYTYAESKTLGGVLWNLKENTVDTAEITKNLEVKNTGGNVVMAFDSTSAPSQPSLKVDFIAKLTGAKKGVEYLSNIVLGANWLSGDGDNEGIRIDNAGNVGIGAGTVTPTHRLTVMGPSRFDYNTTYDVWIQGGENTTTAARNLALVGHKGTDTLYLNHNSEYAGGTYIGGPVSIGPNSLAGIDFPVPGTALQVTGLTNITGQLTGGFGATSTSGVLDWNDATNAVPGSGYTLLRGTTAANAPPAMLPSYFHPFTFEYASKTGAGNLTQFAIPYSPASSLDDGLFYRGRSSGTWTGWYRIPSENPSGNMVVKGTLTAASFSGVGTNLTALNASQLTSGTVPVARLSGSYTGITGTGALNAGSITSGFGNINIGTAALTAGTGTFSGAVSIATAPTANAHAANKAYVDSNIATAGNGRFLPLTGGTLTGSLTMGGTSTINMNSSKIINLANPTAAADAANKSYVDAAAAGARDNLGNHAATTTLNMGGHAITSSAGTIRDGGGGWVRTYGSTGWYNGTYGGGWYMTNSTYILNYGSKHLQVQTGGGAPSITASNSGAHYGVHAYSGGSHGVYAQTGAGTYAIRADAGPGSGAVLGYTNNLSTYGILGHANAYSLYGNGAIYVTGTIQTAGNMIAAAPTAANHLATKAYVDANAGGGAACGAGNLSVQVVHKSTYCGSLQVTGATVTAACPAAAHGQIATCTAGYYGTAWYQCWNGVKTQAGAGFINAGESGGSCW